MRMENPTRQILVIDDEAVFCRNAAAMLCRAGYVARPSGSLTHAMEQLSANPPDLVCLDIRLPDGDGLCFLEMLRHQHPDLPVIVMTGQDSTINRSRADALDAAAFLVKPFALARLVELAGLILGQAPRLISDGLTQLSAASAVMMCSHDSIGLGHVRRNLTIATELVRARPATNVLMLVGCPAGVPFDLPSGVDFLKLPSVTKTDRQEWKSSRLNITREDARELRTKLIQRAVELFQPEVFLVDHVPSGVWDGLLPTLTMLRTWRRPPRVILGLRDILDEPEDLRRAWRDNCTYDVLRRYYDDILIYGREDIHASATAYGLQRTVPGEIRYTGYVSPLAIEHVVPLDRTEFGAGNGRTLFLTGGGGRDATPIILAVLAAIASLPKNHRPGVLVSTGPLMAAEDRAAVMAAGAAIGARVVKSVDGLQTMAAADLVVTMASYNTLTEALRLGRPVVVIPRKGPSAEQRLRAELFEAKGLLTHVPHAQATPPRIAEAIGRALGSVPPRDALGPNGAVPAGHHIAAVLDQRLIAAQAPPLLKDTG